MARARLALDGLSAGDAFGERFFGSPERIEPLLAARAFPPGPWRWTDDTAMALSVVDVLDAHGGINRDALARAFAARYARDPARGYGGGAHRILSDIVAGRPWREAAASAFDGQGSMGNGGAMRAAPIGAYFADDIEAVVDHARASAEPTHAHEDGIAGAIAVAVAASVALAERTVSGDLPDLLAIAEASTPRGPTRDGIAHARTIPLTADVRTAVAALGNGSNVIASDTVPLALWCAARHIGSFEEAMWTTVSALGDRDTTCAIVGGIVALRAGAVPARFLREREALDAHA